MSVPHLASRGFIDVSSTDEFNRFGARLRPRSERTRWSKDRYLIDDGSKMNRIAAMKNKPPTPICTAFLVCRGFATDNRIQDDVLIGLPRAFWTRNFPGAYPLAFFIRCTSAHGNYPLEVQLQNAAGKVVWKYEKRESWEMPEPLEMYDMKVNANVVFPDDGIHTAFTIDRAR